MRRRRRTGQKNHQELSDETRYKRLKMEIGSQPIHEKFISLRPQKEKRRAAATLAPRSFRVVEGEEEERKKCLISHDKGINCVLIFLMHNIPRQGERLDSRRAHTPAAFAPLRARVA
jgi:hypothetical protein